MTEEERRARQESRAEMRRPRSPIKRRRFPKSIVLIAREWYMDGFELDVIYARLRHMGVSRDLLRQWLRYGRCHPDAKPIDYDSWLASHVPAKWDSVRRREQLRPCHRCEARRMAMNGCGTVDIQDYLNSLPYVRCLLTGLELMRPAGSDLFKILFADDEDPAAMPSGFADWRLVEGKGLKKTLLAVHERIRRGGYSPVADEVALFATQGSREEPTDSALLDGDLSRAIDPASSTASAHPDRMDHAVRRPSDPRAWAGAVLHAARQLDEDRRLNKLGKRPFRRSSHVDEIALAAGCSRHEARRAMGEQRQSARSTRSSAQKREVQGYLQSTTGKRSGIGARKHR